jgi:hypothetical protein
MYQQAPVEAHEFTRTNGPSLVEWVRANHGHAELENWGDPRIRLLSDRGPVMVPIGWFIFKGHRSTPTQPQFFAMRPQLFHQLYEQVREIQVEAERSQG